MGKEKERERRKRREREGFAYSIGRGMNGGTSNTAKGVGREEGETEGKIRTGRERERREERRGRFCLL